MYPLLIELLVELEPCPVCGEEQALKPLDVYRNKNRQVIPVEFLALVGCRRCGLAYTHPRPTEEQLERYYAEPEGWESRKQSRPAAELEQKMQRQLASKARRRAIELGLLAPYLPSVDGPRRALDLGCGLGGFLDVLQDEGWETWGIEPGPRQREVAGRRHRMLSEPPSDERFDLVVVNHVIEHLTRPRAVLESLAAATRPGGRLFVSTPDLGRLGEHGRINYVRNERHICSWTAAGLESALALSGWRTIARLEGEQWREIGNEEAWRLKVIAEKADGPLELPPEPLEQAIAALLDYARNAEAFRAAKRERKLAVAAGAQPESARTSAA